MKKFISIILVLLVLTGCSGNNQDNVKIKVVATIFPQYDWVREIAGDSDNIELTLLLNKGVDLHSYQPSANDILAVSSCDIFIYVGGESDEWVADVLARAKNKDMTVINLLDVLKESLHEEETVEGMQGEEEDGEENAEYDEHIWLSLKNAQLACGAIKDALSQKDSENKAIYEANCNSYVEKLQSLDKQYEDAVAGAKRKTVLFCDRFPFRYLTDDYGIKYYAAFVGCSAESEASFETITFLANKVDELGLSSVIALEGTEHKIAQTVISATKLNRSLTDELIALPISIMVSRGMP